MSVASRLAELRKKKLQSKEDNRKDLAKDFQNQRRKSLKLKELEKTAEKDEGYDEDTEKKKDPRLNNLSYTLEECEEWDEKKNLREQAKKRSSGNDYSVLAEQVYNKEVSRIEVDREDYAKQKAHGAAKKGTYRSDNYLVQKPSTAKVNALASGIIETSKKRADALRKKQEAATKNDDSSFINEKNKQFNMKINREYK
ncbi:pre-mRNA-splicing factor Syf2p [[Candida] railenensis]|uniref:Pre-mRNA-splicing factor SYF2 n=1 Tax=[Candida] railenensis TaxID=45579 RepID=A0A9P0QVK6_9ASCO|nr:pre-mRNA-splicing factor Syf2p [[Candida] railenensis]